MASHGPVEEEVDYESLPGGSLGANLVAGAFAGIMEHTVMYPVDAIKTRMQVVNPSPMAVYTGITDGIGKISSREGIRSLWRGIASVAIGAGPAHAVYFGTYETIKHNLGGNAEGGSSVSTLSAVGAAGMCATIASDAVMNPFDVVKQRMQVHGSTYRSISHCVSSVFRNEGIGAFYVSYPTTLAMTVPFATIQFMSYDFLARKLNPTKTYNPLVHCFSGGLAGAIAAAVTTPFDVIKTLLQTKGTSTDDRIRRARSFGDACRIIWEREGARGFARGLWPRVITAMPSTAICWTSYECMKYYLGIWQFLDLITDIKAVLIALAICCWTSGSSAARAEDKAKDGLKLGQTKGYQRTLSACIKRTYISLWGDDESRAALRNQIDGRPAVFPP